MERRGIAVGSVDAGGYVLEEEVGFVDLEGSYKVELGLGVTFVGERVTTDEDLDIALV